ncbi:MAG: PspA/IM30 family protein [Desulfobacteraceae bacterium]|nr:PspA/IM30 family protein [Desulfobacteraceae bacterium]
MAGFFRRIIDIIKANINDLIDRVEDPELMIKKVILEMEDNISRARESLSEAVASEKQLACELNYHRCQSENWLDRAEKAMRDGNEELARTALERKKGHDLLVSDLKVSLNASKNTSQYLKKQMAALENKLTQIRIQRNTLAARRRASEARQYMNKAISSFQGSQDAQAHFEDRILDIESGSEAIAELNKESSGIDREIRQLTIDSDVEKELAILREKIEG